MDPEGIRNAGFNATTLDQLPANATVRDILSKLHLLPFSLSISTVC
jgi:hypothetical protein